MGYTTDFEGSLTIEPPLNAKEVEYINKFSDTRRMNRTNGPYFVGGKGFKGQEDDADVTDHNQPPDGQPGLWCQWIVSENGTTLEWDGGEKFYDATAWMEYIINHFLGQCPIARNANQHFEFLQGHLLNGDIFASGEESSDHWKIEVRNNVVTEKQGHIEYTYE